MIERTITEEIEKSLTQFPVTIITGPRQIGKSTLIYHEFLHRGYHYISLDDRKEKAMAKNDPELFLKSHPCPLIIDEVQKAKELFPEIEAIVNKVRLENGSALANGMYILSGSNSKSLLDGAKESLAGRANILHMLPLSMREVQGKKEEPFVPNKSPRFLMKCQDYSLSEKELLSYIVRGFLPELYNNPDISAQSFYSSYLQTYMERDLPDEMAVKDDVKFENFLMLLASNSAQELVYENYASQIGVSAITIKVWINILFKMGIVYLAYPYHEQSLAKRIVKRPKCYFFDTGFACYLAGIRDAETLAASFLKGRMVETYFFNEIRKSYVNHNDDIPFYYYRDSAQNEIDMVLVQNGTLSCIEFKSGTEYSKKNVDAFALLKPSRLLPGTNAIVCTSSVPYSISEDTLVLPVSSI